MRYLSSSGRDRAETLAGMYRTLSTLRGGIALGLALLASLAAGASLADDESLWAALKEGGKVVLMRHAHVEMGQGGLGKYGRGNCAVEVNLTQRGQAQARQIGEAFRAHGITVGEVLASPFCRNLDTGKLAFGRATPAEFLMPPGLISDQQYAANMERASRLIAQYRGPGNLVLISHGPDVSDIGLLPFVEFGEFAVLKPKGGDDFNVLGTILLPDLTAK